MKSFTVISTLLFLLAPSVSAHGFVKTLTVDGKNFNGNDPSENGAKTKDSVIQRVANNAPIKLAQDPQNLLCGRNAKTAALVADAMPGDTVLFDWVAGGGQNWPHNTGPMLTYMASCGSQTCNEFDATKAKWFKIDQVGKKQNGNEWVQNDLRSGAPAKVTIPKNLAAGNYLVRHEIIALHLATDVGGAEFYPSCSQLRVGGTGTGKPKESELVSFPGAYKARDAGIFVPNVFDPKAKYTFPGPAVASLVSDGSSETSGDSSDNTSPAAPSSTKSSDGKPTQTSGVSSSSASSTPAVKGSTSSGSSKGNCKSASKKMKKRSQIDVARPHHISRIMRDLQSK